MTFRISNVGDADLLLGEVSTTCGCTAGTIEKGRLRSGESTSLTVKGIPPGSGEKTVMVTVQSNSSAGGNLNLKLVMQGPNIPPYVADRPDVISF